MLIPDKCAVAEKSAEGQLDVFSSNSFPSDTNACDVPSSEFFQGTPKGDPLILEVFAGSCRLSQQCRRLGLRAFSIDKDPSRSEGAVVAKFDLTNKDDFKAILQYVDAEASNVIHAHFAPACGTASMARSRPVKGCPNAPRPLRSEDQPDGLDSLTEREQARVAEANRSYEATVAMIMELIGRGVSVSIENPLRSLFWKTSFLKTLFVLVPNGHYTHFANCMHGGERDKRTTFWSFNPRCPEKNMFESLALECDRSHTHASWTPRFVDGKWKFPTHEEAAYPTLLCVRMASLFVDEAAARGLSLVESLAEQVENSAGLGKRPLFTTQTRGNKLKQLIPEWGAKLTCVVPLCNVELKNISFSFPKGSQITQRQLHLGFCRDSWDSLAHFIDERLTDGQNYEVLTVSIPLQPLEFVKQAVSAGHPKNLFAKTSDLFLAAIRDTFVEHPEKLQRKRASFMKKWLKRALELQPEEKRLHDSMPPYIAKILKGKKLLLFREILLDLGYPDESLVQNIIDGFALTGWAEPSNVFRPHVRPPSIHLKQLDSMCYGLNLAVVNSLKNSKWEPSDQVAWDETLAEVDKGWLGECESVDLKHDIVAKRFPIQQGEKTRLIDDCSICGLNSAFGLVEHLRVECIDEVAAGLAVALSEVRDRTNSDVAMGRTFDLKSAYRQFAVDQEHSSRLKIALKAPSGDVAYFRVCALPFGATGSVSAFLRVSAALAYVGLKGLSLPWTAFFDDFTTLTTGAMKDNTTFYAESLFRLLGITFASEGGKAEPFGVQFKTLGLVVDLTSFPHGYVEIAHTQKRKAELLQDLLVVSESRTVPRKRLEQLRGRMVWFGSFIFGRLMNDALRVLSVASRSKSANVAISEELKSAVLNLHQCLQSSRHVKVQPSLSSAWIIFSDGAFEPDATMPGTIGAVLVSPSGCLVEYFGEGLPDELLKIFLADSKHPIYELEILPVLAAIECWADRIAGAPVVHYLDNNAARAAFVKGHAATRCGKIMLRAYVKIEYTLGIIPWFSRVPSDSNVSDRPSRLDFTDPCLQHAKRVRLDLPSHFLQWGISGCAGNQLTS